MLKNIQNIHQKTIVNKKPLATDATALAGCDLIGRNLQTLMPIGRWQIWPWY